MATSVDNPGASISTGPCANTHSQGHLVAQSLAHRNAQSHQAAGINKSNDPLPTLTFKEESGIENDASHPCGLFSSSDPEDNDLVEEFTLAKNMSASPTRKEKRENQPSVKSSQFLIDSKPSAANE